MEKKYFMVLYTIESNSKLAKTDGKKKDIYPTGSFVYIKFKTKILARNSFFCKWFNSNASLAPYRRPEVFLGKGILKICSKFTGEHQCRSVISIKLQSNVIEIAFRYGCSPINLLHIFRIPFPRNTSASDLIKLSIS